MNAKIERVIKDIDKAREKINEQQARLRELERQKTELENIEIVEAVRGNSISFDDLAALLKNMPATSGQVVPKSAASKKTAKPVNTEPGDIDAADEKKEDENE